MSFQKVRFQLIQSIPLNDGNVIPQVGLGTAQAKGTDVTKAVEHAIKIGYRHLDLAKMYSNQRQIGEALKASIPAVVKREDLFITSKLWNNAHKPEVVESTLDDTLDELGIEYLDLYLMHWPVAFDAPSGEMKPQDHGTVKLDLQTSVVDTWKAMIALKKTGKVKSIGVSNFRPDVVDGIIKATGVAPAVNQIEAHPLLPQDELVEHHKAKNIVITAYAPLGNNLSGLPKIVEYPEVKAIAEKHGATPAQILLAWGVQRGYVVIPKSLSPEHIDANFAQITLSDEEYKEVSELPKRTGGFVRFFTPYKTFNPNWDVDIFHDPEEKDATHQIKVE